jgi:nucleoside-diphosphate-sugar epimerase
MRVLVTGASGFIGGILCAELLGAGHEVGALVRRAGSEPPGTRPLAGDLADGPALREILARERPDWVMHLAAEIASQRSEEKLREVNVEGTGRLIEACRAGGAGDGEEGGQGVGPKFIFASTVVTGEANGALLTEEQPLPVSSPYGRSKQEGERIVLGSGLPAVVIRPSHVYGPGGWYASELIPRLRQRGRFAVVGSGQNLWDVVHVEDVVSAMMLAAERAQTGRIYHVVDDEPITYGAFMALTAAELGVGPPRRVPAAVARRLAGRNAVGALVRSARSSNARLRSELGWVPRFPTARDGIADSVARLSARR